MFYEKFIGKWTFALYVLVFLFPILMNADDGNRSEKKDRKHRMVKRCNPNPPYNL